MGIRRSLWWEEGRSRPQTKLGGGSACVTQFHRRGGVALVSLGFGGGGETVLQWGNGR